MKRAIGPLLLVFLLGTTIPTEAEFGPEYGTELEIIFYTYDDKPETELLYLYRTLRYDYFKDPAWSPDGKWIAFTGKIANGLWIVSSKGGKIILIDNENSGDDTEPDYFKEGYKHLSFTPDGQEITYETNVFDVKRGSVLTEVNNLTAKTNFIPSIESINIFTGEKRIIVEEGKDPCWSRNGRYLAYIHLDSRVYTDVLQAEHNGDLAVYDTVTGETFFLTDHNYPNIPFGFQKSCFSGECFVRTLDRTKYDQNRVRDPSFSPEGSNIAYIYHNQLYKIPFEGGEIEKLTNFQGTNQVYYSKPELSPDGRWIIFTGSTGGSLRKLLIYDTLSGESYYVFSGEKFVPFKFIYQPGITVSSEESPKWSLDGGNFCYIINDLENITKYMIRIADFDPDRYNAQKNESILVESEKPSGFALRGNYPNPFNPSTTIDFTLPHSGFASLLIYNMTGQKVRGLVSQNMTHGVHSVTWDGRDDNGRAVSSGVYISRLQMGTQITAKQMMLMK